MSARWNLEPDLCDMPVGYGQTCDRPADHGGGCRMPVPRCRCSHVRHAGQCYSTACGCQTYRPENP